MILGVFMIAQRRHPFRRNAVQSREFPVRGDVRTVAKDLEVGHRTVGWQRDSTFADVVGAVVLYIEAVFLIGPGISEPGGMLVFGRI
jgi:hypothetical protein